MLMFGASIGPAKVEVLVLVTMRLFMVVVPIQALSVTVSCVAVALENVLRAVQLLAMSVLGSVEEPEM
jgi:hypothetical protein